MSLRISAIFLFVVFLSLFSLAFSEFKIESVNVVFSNMQKDGTVSVRESVKFFVIGDYEQQLYKSGFDKNDLSFWATATSLKDVKFHVNPNLLDIRDFRITPQALKKCDPFSAQCRGELIIEYTAAPYYNKTSTVTTSGTGIFTTESPKPRTVRYTLNPNALGFTTTEGGDIILEKYVTLAIELPKNSVIYKLNPQPEDYSPGSETLTWTDTMLVRFSIVFDVEDSISKEVTGFFSALFLAVENMLGGPEGLAIIIIAIVLLAAYLYLKSVKPKK